MVVYHFRNCFYDRLWMVKIQNGLKLQNEESFSCLILQLYYCFANALSTFFVIFFLQNIFYIFIRLYILGNILYF